MIGNSLLLGPEGYQISRSVRLRSSASAYFNRTFGSSSYGHTFSFWIKRGSLGAARSVFGYSNGSTESFGIEFNSSDQLDFYSYSTAYIARRLTTQVFRDPSAWYHIVCFVDSANATASQRMRVYVNGSEITSFSATVNQAQNQYLNLTQGTWSWGIGRLGGVAIQYLDGYLAEFNYVEQALTPSSFGETDAVTGVWKPKKYAGTYGTNGFFLNFSDNSSNTASTIGKDYSGNGNNWTPNNISVTAGVTYDSMLDVPTPWADGGNGRGNYAVLNPLDNFKSATPTNGNLSIPGTGSCKATMAFLSGKWYWEFSVVGLSGVAFVGIATDTTNAGITTGNYWFYRSDGQRQTTSGASAYGASYTSGDVIGIAYDADTNTLTFYKNNTSQGNISVTSGFVLFPMVVQSASTTYDLNFGQRPFSYTPPTGFKALNTLNLPDSTIPNGSKNFDVSLWTGDQAARTITNNGSFQPDLVWTKSRSAVESHRLHDSVRGGNGTVLYELNSNETSAEGTDTLVSGFTSNGFTIASGANSPNVTGRTYVGWQWKAGGAAVTNTAGSISSQVSANPTAGFSVVTYTGTGANATVGHGLGVAPKMIILRARSIVENWPTWHTSLTSAAYVLTLNTTNAQASVPSVFNSTAPTSSVFSVGTSSGANQSSATYVAYCFSEVAGFSKFGSYTGNGSADGPFVFCGFRPRFILAKSATTAATNWFICDTARSPENVADEWLLPNGSNAEQANVVFDILSNGFKLRNSVAEFNTNGSTYIFAAFAENPFKNSLAR